jgi:hypothetical protein
VTETPRDEEPDDARSGRVAPRRNWHYAADEPTTGPPSGAATAPVAGARAALGSATAPTRGATAAPGGSTALTEKERRLRRRRRFFTGGIAVGAAIIVIVLCAGLLTVIAAVTGFRDRADAAREDRRLRDADCLELEQRLNRLVPPGATTTPQARAVAIRDENAAVRIYVTAARRQRDQDAWRQVLDARTAYAEALDLQAKSRTPAFYVAPRTPDGGAVTDELVRWSPNACAGPIRRLAAPDV